jgi:hypothetical protein
MAMSSRFYLLTETIHNALGAKYQVELAHSLANRRVIQVSKQLMGKCSPNTIMDVHGQQNKIWIEFNLYGKIFPYRIEETNHQLLIHLHLKQSMNEKRTKEVYAQIQLDIQV